MPESPNPFEAPAQPEPTPRRLRWVAPLVVFVLVGGLALRSWWAEGDHVYEDACVPRCVRANLRVPDDEADVKAMCVRLCKDFERGELSRVPGQR